MNPGLFQAVTRPLPHAVLLCAADGRILASNLAALRALPELAAGNSLVELEAGDPEVFRRHLDFWLRSGDPLPGSLTVERADGARVRFRCHGARATWWNGDSGPVVQLHLTPLDRGDQFMVLSQRVTALDQEVAFRRVVEDERRRLLAAERAGRSRLQRLYRFTAALTAATTLADVVEATGRAAPVALDAAEVVPELHSRRLVPSLEPAESLLAMSGQDWVDLDHGAPAPGGPRTDEGAPGDRAVREDRAAGDTGGSVVRMPLEAAGLVLGRLTVRYGSAVPPEPEHITAVVQQIAQAVRRAGLYEHEHRLAERLQRSLLPRLPDVAGLGVAGRYAPGTSMVEVGGDWYDVYVLGEHHVGLSVGDVAGHGLAEAAVMARISAALRSIVLRCGHAPAVVLQELNAFVDTYHPGLMATACYLVLDRRSGTVRYSRAGHPPPLLIGADGGSRHLDEGLAPPLGPVPEVCYREAELTVGGGETLLLYTDGLIERRGESLDVGLARLAALARDSVGLTVDELCDLFLHHQPGADFPDDRALLAVRLP
ncbi:PP2C family protein-serine/threonine phosphatase [Streptomyces sp. DH37]|uniref:PP2C family protein-serine/threonine phosphatase n=1 Tax=Streptomyces sp. DH37 TaxID=3040122 RepID=UPI002442A374|nr:PP2C family protein-serine/threonine phosphatase [Streptomyces sp. DH37]MDG9704838.1 PP2C family protein-serine/threonine phosphatase [Streptomyces sp. DH37]